MLCCDSSVAQVSKSLHSSSSLTSITPSNYICSTALQMAEYRFIKRHRHSFCRTTGDKNQNVNLTTYYVRTLKKKYDLQAPSVPLDYYFFLYIYNYVYENDHALPSMFLISHGTKALFVLT